MDVEGQEKDPQLDGEDLKKGSGLKRFGVGSERLKAPDLPYLHVHLGVDGLPHKGVSWREDSLKWKMRSLTTSDGVILEPTL